MQITPGMDFASKYHILEEVGRGRMGSVYKAHQPDPSRYVALRILPPSVSAREGFQQRFEKEVPAAAGLRHANILETYDYGATDNGTYYIVAEFVEGGSLAAHVGSPISLNFTTRVLAFIAAALDYAHAQGVLHRDIKPANILIARNGKPLLADFGLTRLLEGMATGLQSAHGLLAGTPAYMAPEYALGTPIGPAADRYALAVVAYEMLVGQVPFTAETPLAVLLAHASRPLPSPRSLNPRITEAVEEVLTKALAKEPGDRYPTAAAFVAALEVAGSIAAPVQAPTPAPMAPAVAAPASTPLSPPPPIVQQGGSRPAPRPGRSATKGAGRGGADRTGRAATLRARLALSTLKMVAYLRNRVPRPALIGGAVVVVLVLVGIVYALAHGGGGTLVATPTPSPSATVQASPSPAQASPSPSVTSPHGLGAWTRVAGMQTARAAAQAVVLKDGRVLVIGGLGASSGLADAELFDPKTKTWAPAGTMATGRGDFTATLLASGEVLVAGGNDGENPMDSAEIYDPKAGSWATTGSMHSTRTRHVAVLLRDNRVLVAGGEDTNDTALASAEIYDPATGKWAATGTMTSPRIGATATLLLNGKVLVAGGEDSNGTPLASTEIYDPATRTWKATGGMATARTWHTATLLQDGKVLVAGGETTVTALLNSAELYDPASGRWAAAGTMAASHSRHSAVLLNDGRVLVTGGSDGNGSQGPYNSSVANSVAGIGATDLYDPQSGAWSRGPAMHDNRAQQVAALLADGQVLVAGGFGDGGNPTNSSELSNPVAR